MVESARILTERDTGRARGFGVVAMPDATAAQAAIDGLNGTSLGGRALTVSEARPREERRPRDGGDGHRCPRWYAQGGLPLAPAGRTMVPETA
jgi:RNA recognition motif-containing protein